MPASSLMKTTSDGSTTGGKKRFQVLKTSHAKQITGCVALPTFGRNQSMFDTDKFHEDMTSEPLGFPSEELGCIQEDKMDASTKSANSTGSAISEFWNARIQTFTRNMDTIASLVTGGSAPPHEEPPRKVTDESIFVRNLETIAGVLTGSTVDDDADLNQSERSNPQER